MIDRHGGLIPSASANEALAIVWEIIEKAIDYSNSTSDTIDPSTSLYDFFTQQCKSMVQSGELAPADEEVVLRMSEMWGAYVGDRVERQSLKFFFMEDCIEGSKLIAFGYYIPEHSSLTILGDCFIPSNYKKIMARVAARPLDAAEIRLNTVMESVTADHTAKTSHGKVRIRTVDGSDEAFDAVLVTTPLGWLKRHKDAIRPLTARINQAINALSFGNLEKVWSIIRDLGYRSFITRSLSNFHSRFGTLELIIKTEILSALCIGSRQSMHQHLTRRHGVWNV